MKKAEVIELEPIHGAPVDDTDYKPSDIDLSFSDRFNVRDIYHPQSNHSVERKIEAVSAYAVTGTSLMASKACGISANTIRTWKAKACWWSEALSAAKLQLDSKVEAGLRNGLERGLEIIQRQMLEGRTTEVGTEEYMEVDPDTGIEKKKKMKIFEKHEVPIKEMTVTWAIMWDKLQLATGKPTSRTEKIESPQQIMEQLRTELTSLSQKMTADKIANSIEEPDKTK